MDLRVGKEDKLTAAAEEEEKLLEIINSEIENREATFIVPREEKEDCKQENIVPQNKRRKKYSKNKWVNLLPRRSSKRLARMEADSTSQLETNNGAIQVDTTENTAGKSEINSSSDQVYDQIVGTELKDNNGKEELDQSILNALLVDPSIDFAIKILTDVIPIEEYLNKVSVASPDPTSASSSATPFRDT